MTKTRTFELAGQATLFAPETREVSIQLAGLRHDNRHFNALRAAKKGAIKAVALVREPENEFDPNAVHVRAYLKDNERLDLGYIPRDRAAVIAPLMDAGVYVRVDVGSYKAWRPDRRKPDSVVATMTLSWTEGVR